MPARCSLLLFVACVTLAACGSSNSPGTVDAAKPIDAAVRPDAAPATVMTVACPATPDATVTSSDVNQSSYTPRTTTITVGKIVKFTMSPTHNVAPSLAGMTDTGLMVDFGKEACLKFTKAGTFDFFCTSHSFTGSVIVQ